jgi:hypothetical protein
MTSISKNIPDQTAPARPRRRSSRRRTELPKTRDTDLPAGKISFKTAADAPPANAFPESKRRSIHRPETCQTPIPHSAVTQQNRR